MIIYTLMSITQENNGASSHYVLGIAIGDYFLRRVYTDSKMVAPEYLAIASVLTVAVTALLMSTLERTLTETFTAGNNFDIAQAVTRAYKNVLDRTPTEPELVEYHGRLQDDDTFDVSALENALRETGEYRRLVRLQTQSANPGLEGALTEAQVLGKLRGFYRKRVGVDPDEATLVFLRERYRRTSLDDLYIQGPFHLLHLNCIPVDKSIQCDIWHKRLRSTFHGFVT